MNTVQISSMKNDRFWPSLWWTPSSIVEVISMKWNCTKMWCKVDTLSKILKMTKKSSRLQDRISLKLSLFHENKVFKSNMMQTKQSNCLVRQWYPVLTTIQGSLYNIKCCIKIYFDTIKGFCSEITCSTHSLNRVKCWDLRKWAYLAGVT